MPEWFKELPFDDAAMAETIIDNKLDNLIGVLNYPLEDTKRHNTFSSLFDFELELKSEVVGFTASTFDLLHAGHISICYVKLKHNVNT